MKTLLALGQPGGWEWIIILVFSIIPFIIFVVMAINVGKMVRLLRAILIEVKKSEFQKEQEYKARQMDLREGAGK